MIKRLSVRFTEPLNQTTLVTGVQIYLLCW